MSVSKDIMFRNLNCNLNLVQILWHRLRRVLYVVQLKNISKFSQQVTSTSQSDTIFISVVPYQIDVSFCAARSAWQRNSVRHTNTK